MHSFYGTRLSENMAKTPEGYLICYDVNIARIGSQDYLGSELGTDDDVISVNRTADEVFKPSTVASFEGKPFTNEHPYKLLDVNDTAIYEKGHVQNVRVSDDKTYLVADIMVKDVQTIRDIENGKRELSAGYECDCIKDEDGNWYQCNIIGNHVALVDKGRAGNKVRINDNEWKEQDHPRAKDGKFTSGGGSNSGSKQEKNTSKKENKTQFDKPIESRKRQRDLSKEDNNRIKSEFSRMDLNFLPHEIEGISFLIETGGIKRKELEDWALGEKLNESDWQNVQWALEQTGLVKQQSNGDLITVSENKTEKKESISPLKGEPSPSHYSSNQEYKEELKKWASKKLASVYSTHPTSFERAEAQRQIPRLMQILSDRKPKEIRMDKNTVLGKLLKAFAKDAQPEEMVEAINAVKGEDEVPETSRIDEIEAKLAELSAKFEKLYEAEKKEEQGEMHALDELEKEITDGCKVEDEEKEEEKTEVKDEDAKNDPKLIEAISEKAQNDEDTTEEIKKEIADAKKVIAKIEDVATRKAVADSLAKIIRGKITSNFNYKKLMDASKQKTQTEDNKIDYNEAFRKIKENNFRK